MNNKQNDILKLIQEQERLSKEAVKLTKEINKEIFKFLEQQHVCALCGEKYEGFGNNAEPIYNARCCDVCNDVYVIPVRLGTMTVEEVESKVNNNWGKLVD